MICARRKAEPPATRCKREPNYGEQHTEADRNGPLFRKKRRRKERERELHECTRGHESDRNQRTHLHVHGAR